MVEGVECHRAVHCACVKITVTPRLPRGGKAMVLLPEEEKPSMAIIMGSVVSVPLFQSISSIFNPKFSIKVLPPL